MTRLLAVVIGVLLAATAVGGQQSAYVIGSQDVLTVSVYDQPELTGKFTVEADGSVTFPLVGRLQVGGLTLRETEERLRKTLADGYLKNPQVSVAIDEYKSQRVFVMGEVRAPGAYQLTGDMTIIEVLARAGGTTQAAADEVQIVRPRNGGTGGPVTPDQDKDVEVLRVDLRELQSGALSQNIMLHDSDTIIVPRAQAVYVFGQVKSPGAYPIERGTTVLQALSLAGGVTDRGSTGRIRIVRTVDGKKKEVKVKLTDIVEPGDTVIVAERFF
jgi:polysaccharide biosynthesis/export protein